jgi:hypothetical protein
MPTCVCAVKLSRNTAICHVPNLDLAGSVKQTVGWVTQVGHCYQGAAVWANRYSDHGRDKGRFVILIMAGIRDDSLFL